MSLYKSQKQLEAEVVAIHNKVEQKGVRSNVERGNTEDDQLASTELKGVAGTQHQDQLASTELKEVAGTQHQVKLASTGL